MEQVLATIGGPWPVQTPPLYLRSPARSSGSRAVRHLRRQGGVPGIVYGGGEDPVPFQVDSRELRQALAHAGAVLDLKIGGEGATPVVLKELVRHPVSGATMHIDLLGFAST